jgi:prolyl 4-hydroxylase
MKKQRFQRSFVDGAATSSSSDGTSPTATEYDSTNRTSTFVSFQKNHDRHIAAIERRAAALLGCWSSSVSVEPIQLVRYLPRQFFGVHHDLGAYDPDTGAVHLPPRQIWCKRRLVTLFCYLNAVPQGGATHFPACASDLRVQPHPGRAVLFANILPSGLPDPRTIHAGEPVLVGTKYGLNIWICEE